MIKIKSAHARRVLAEHGDEEVIQFMKDSAKYFGAAELIAYEGKNEEKIRKILERNVRGRRLDK